MASFGIAGELKCFAFLAPKPWPGFQPWELSSFWPYESADWDQARLFGSREILRRLCNHQLPIELIGGPECTFKSHARAKLTCAALQGPLLGNVKFVSTCRRSRSKMCCRNRMISETVFGPTAREGELALASGEKPEASRRRRYYLEKS